MWISDWWIKEWVMGLSHCRHPILPLEEKHTGGTNNLSSPQVSQQGVTVITGPWNRSDWMLFSRHWFYYLRPCFHCFDQKCRLWERLVLRTFFKLLHAVDLNDFWLIGPLPQDWTDDCKSDWRVPVEVGVEGQIKPSSFQLVFQPEEWLNQPE